MEDWTHKDIFEIAWKHFDVIADQRMRAFNFYVLMLAASMGASLTALERNAGLYALIICGMFCVGAGSAFLMIEIRTRRLLEIPKNVMVALEIGDHWPSNLRLFSVDNLRQAGLRRGFISYSVAFRSTMAAHIAFGFVIILMAFCPRINPLPHVDKTTQPTTTSSQATTPQ